MKKDIIDINIGKFHFNVNNILHFINGIKLIQFYHSGLGNGLRDRKMGILMKMWL